MPSPLSPTPTFGIAQRFTLSRAPLHLSQFSSSPCCTSCKFFFFFCPLLFFIVLPRTDFNSTVTIRRRLLRYFYTLYPLRAIFSFAPSRVVPVSSDPHSTTWPHIMCDRAFAYGFFCNVSSTTICIYNVLYVVHIRQTYIR